MQKLQTTTTLTIARKTTMTAMKKMIGVKDDSSNNKDDGRHAHVFARMHVCTHSLAHILARAYTLARN